MADSGGQADRGDARGDAYARRFALLSRVSGSLIRSGAPEERLDAVLADVAAEAGAHYCFNYLVDGNGGQLRLSALLGLDDEQRAAFACIGFGEHLCGKVAAERRELVLADIEGRIDEGSAGVRALDVRAYAGFPLIAEGRLVGTVAFASIVSPRFDDGEVALMRTVADQIAAAIDRARAERALRLSEARLRLVQQAGGVGSFDYDVASGRIHRSAEYCAIHGLGDCELEVEFSEKWRARLHPDDRARIEAAFEGNMRNPAPFELEYRIRRADDGETRWIVNRGVVVADDAGRAVRLISAQTDVTERKAVEETLAARNRELGNAIEAGGFGTWTMDLATLELGTSEVCRIAYGRDPHKDFSWTELLESVHPEDRERMETTASHSAATGADYDIEYRIVTPAGQTRTIYIRAQPALDADGKPISMVGISLDVTERRRADDALRASEARFRTLVETVTTLVWQTDGEGSFIDDNPAWERFTGQRVEDYIGLGWVDAIHPGDRDQLYRIYRRALAAKSDYRCEYRLRRADGEYRLMQVNGASIVDAGGEVIEWIGANTDLTEQRRAENALRESEARFRLIADSAPVPIWVTKLDRTRGFVNQAYVDFLGMTYHEALEFDWRERIHPDDAEALRAASIAGEASMESFTLEGRYRRADGEWRWLRSESQPRWDAAGDHSGFIGVAYDVTDAKEAELRLRESEARFRNMADHAPVMMWVTRPDGSCTYLNKCWYDFTGQSEAEAGGFGWLDATHPDDKAEAERAFLDANANHTRFRVEYRLRRADGAYRWAIDAAAPRFGPDGEFAGFVGSVIDIDERREMEDRLRISEARLRAAVEAVEGVVWTNSPGGEMRGEQAGWGALTGQSCEDYQGFGWAKAVHPDDVEPTIDAWRRAVETRSTFEFEHRVCSADHVWRDYAVRAIPTFDADGEILEWVGVHTDITERKRAEDALRASEERYRTLFNSIDAGFCIVEMKFDADDTAIDYRIVEHNPAFARQTGLSDVAGKWASEFAPDLERYWHDTYGRVALTGEPVRFENRAESFDRWYDVHAYRVGEPAGHRVAILFNDISDRRRTEEKLRASEAEMRLVTDSLPVLVSYIDHDCRYRFNNRAYEDWFGRKREDIAGHTMREVLGDAAFVRIEPYVRRALAGEHVRFEAHITYRDAGPRDVEVEYIPYFGADGRARGYYSMVQDVSDRKAAALAERKHAAEREAILQQLAEGVMIADARGHITFANDAAAALHGVEAIDITPGAYTRTFSLLSEDGEPLEFDDLPLTRAFRDGEATIGMRWRLVRPDGVELVVLGSAQPVMGPGGGLMGAVLTFSDDTARAGAEQALERLNETLEARVLEETAERMKAEDSLRQAQKMEAIGALTGGIAHDFNNLLTVIMSSADLLKRPGIADEKRARYVEAIAETAQRAAALTSQLLAFARRQPLSSEAFDAAQRVRALRPMLGTMLGERVRLAIKASAGPLVIKADPNQFENALLNMAVNARDAMPGGGKLTIMLSVNADPAFIDVAVADTGQGIAPDKLAAIFEPFYTTKAVGKGTGLGLSQVYGFAKQSGGRIEVASEPGKGTCFTMMLPRGERADAPLKSETPAARDMRPAHILVVEDNRAVGEFAARLLDDMGHSVVLETDGESALRRVEAGETFDLIFSDVIMPGAIDGLALARKLRADHPALPVILTTGYAQGLAEDATHGFEILRKPYSADALAALIAKAVL